MRFGSSRVRKEPTLYSKAIHVDIFCGLLCVCCVFVFVWWFTGNGVHVSEIGFENLGADLVHAIAGGINHTCTQLHFLLCVKI